MFALLGFLVGGVILYSLSQGAPLVPTKRQGMEVALAMMALRPGQTVVDLGCGDGRFLALAARHGYRAVGIELNPLIWLIARLVTARYGRQATVVLGNIKRWQLPDETKAVYMFSAEPFMPAMARWLQAEADRLQRNLTVVTYGAQLPQPAEQVEQGCSQFIIRPTKH